MRTGEWKVESGGQGIGKTGGLLTNNAIHEEHEANYLTFCTWPLEINISAF
jgi:hypothetical protein